MRNQIILQKLQLINDNLIERRILEARIVLADLSNSLNEEIRKLEEKEKKEQEKKNAKRNL